MDEQKYYVASEGTRYGPYTAQELVERGLEGTTLVWTDGMDSWVEAREVPQLQDVLASLPPTVPAPPVPQGVRRSQRGWIVGGIVGFVLLVLAVTCPDSGQHRDAVGDEVNRLLSAQLDSTMGDGVLGSIMKPVGGWLVDAYVLAELDVHNWLLFSYGTIEKDGETRLVSLGVLGHVFTPGIKEQALSDSE